MDNSEMNDDYGVILNDIFGNDQSSAHIVWNCEKRGTYSFGRVFLPGSVEDPLEFIRLNDLVSRTSIDAFNVFCSYIYGGMLSGIDKTCLSLDLRMRFSPDDDFTMHHLYATMLLNSSGKVRAVHLNARPFTVREKFDLQVMNAFTSDKSPEIFGRRCRQYLDAHPDEKVAFVQFDVERFKLINEDCGVETGDEMLRFMSDSLGVICGDDKPFCRLTADVFMILTTFADEEKLTEYIRHIESMLSGYKELEYRLVFGVAVVEDRTLHTRIHGDNAGLARRQVHGNALNNIGWYNGRATKELHKVQDIEDEMYKALASGEFLVYFQPKYSISTGKIIGAEALVRWNHRERGMVPPGEFIPVFEQNGFILRLDQYVWEHVVQSIKRWLVMGVSVVPVSVNISREYVNTFDCASYLTGLLRKYNVPIHLLELEITETVDTNGVGEAVAQMKGAGFTMLMDDFGSGYSSLNMLKTTQFDVLKIDRAFLSEFMDSVKGRKIIEHTITMSQDIGLDVIAEGVETAEQADFLENCGCDAAQGFFFSKPVSEEEFEERLVAQGADVG